MKYNTARLTNGLRVIHLPCESGVVYCGYQLAAGTRCEQPGEEGLAHFCEHVTFKGTERRSSMQILNTLERVGGDLNAFTNKETTVYYAALPKNHLAKAIDVLTDIVFCSTYPQQEIDKEVEVVCDEIESYQDTPAELIYDEFENIIFAGHPLGHNILGEAERVRQFTTADTLSFSRRYYRPDNAVFFAYGDVDFQKLLRMLDKASMERNQNKIENISPSSLISEIQQTTNGSTASKAENQPCTQATHIIKRGTHQAHVMLGTRAYAFSHPNRLPLYVLNNMLGGPAMNARLNISLRERRGLVYTVESTMTCYSDTGVWSVYFGCDPEDVKRCLRLVRSELDKFMQHPLSDHQLTAAKKQLKGQLSVASDNRENFALDFGRSYLLNGSEHDLSLLYERINAVTASQIEQVANELFPPERLTTLIFQ